MIKEIAERWKTNSKSGVLCKSILTTYTIGKIISSSNLKFITPIITILHKFLCMLSGCSIPYQAKIATTVLFPHGLYGVFISKSARIDNNCTIYHHVTIGSSSLRVAKAPIINNDVLIGAGSKVIGEITIKSGTRIKAGDQVFDDIL
ncbi:hypothetical protein [Cobetia marina]|uniref:hypothetical protein n=1 Tax=Cobetia marina TaxID=28258 RepID=UPI0038579C30